MRGSGEGSIFQDKTTGLWVVRVELPTHDGTRRRVTKRRKSKGEAIALLDELKTQLKQSGDLPTASMTVDTWFEYWLREIVVKTRRPSTVRSYRSMITQQISPVIGNIRLDKLTPINIRKVISVMDRNGRSSTYQRNAHSIMAAAFTDAAREGRIHRNPVDLVQAPLKAVTTLDMLTADETRRLLELFSDSPDAYLWATFLLTGGRRGEVIGLEWDRVGDVIDLSWQLQRIGQDATVPANYERRHIQGGLWWTRPKSRAGWREIPLVQPLRGILDEWRAVAPSNPWGLVFTRTAEDGRQIPLDPDYISRAWPVALKAAGITRRIRLHDARHTTVELLYAAGIPEADIKEIVGHSTVEMSRSYRSKQNQPRLRAALEMYSKSLGFEAA